MLSDPIVALATPPGRSAVALIRLSGRGAFDVAARALRPFQPDPPRTVHRVQVVHPATGAPVDDALAACFRARAARCSMASSTCCRPRRPPT